MRRIKLNQNNPPNLQCPYKRITGRKAGLVWACYSKQMSYLDALAALEPHLQQASPPEARQHLLALLGEYPQTPELHYRLGVLCQAQQWPEAQHHYQAVLAHLPAHAPSWFGLGFLAFRQANDTRAEDYFRQAVRFQPDFVLALDYLAQVCLLREARLEAVELWERCAQLQPDPRWHTKLTLHYQKLKRWSDAYRHAQVWLAQAPQSADAYNEAGLILIQLRQPEAARQAFEQALQRAPEFAEVWTNLGRLAKSCGQMEAALDAYKRAVETRPDYAEGWYNLGVLYEENGQAPAARHAVQRALGQQPMLFRPAQTGPTFLPTPQSERALLALRQALILPRVYADQAEMAEYRSQLVACLASLQGIDLHVVVPERELMGLTPFYLTYQGQNDRAISHALAQLLTPVLDCAPALERSPSGPLRIGLVSAFFQDHSVTHCFGSMIQALGAEPDWAVTLFLTPAAQPDAVTQALGQKLKLVQLPATLAEARQTLLKHRLDLLIYPELGMDSFSWLLAFARLAPVQAVLSGHPVTSGIPNQDYFISHDSLETPEAQSHYSETLITLPGVPVNYTLPPRRSAVRTRAELGLSERAHLYFCPMTLFKLHPDFDAVLAQILAQDPLAEILLFRYHHTLLHQILADRLQRQLPPAHFQRVKFLPWAHWETFMALLENADVVLDTPHFGGGNTLYLAFSRALPVVTWPSPFQRGRGGVGLYQAMGLDFGVATDLQDYAHRAVQLATEPEWNRQCRSQLAQQQHLLFGQTQSTQALIDWVRSLTRA